MMTALPRHHIPEPMLAAYAAGRLPHAFELVVATHVSLCDDCRAALAAQDVLGGALLETAEGAAVTATARDAVMAALERPAPALPDDGPRATRDPALRIYPAPLAQAMGQRPPAWRAVGGGVRQQVLHREGPASVRLLLIPGGMAVPDHGHGGTELTMVLQGAFTDETGRYAAGDVEVADESLEHTPVAEPGPDCICLAATDSRLRFRALLPRLAQPFLRI